MYLNKNELYTYFSGGRSPSTWRAGYNFRYAVTRLSKTQKEILQDAINLHNKANDSDISFDDIFDEPEFGSGKDALDGWSSYYKSNIENGIIIKGSSDNSIPYWMFDFIESAFGFSTERFHLG